MDEMMDEQVPAAPQAAAKLVDHEEYSEEFEKLLDLLQGARHDAAQLYIHGNKEAGIRMRGALVKAEKYGKWLRADSLAVSKGEDRPEPFDWE